MPVAESSSLVHRVLLGGLGNQLASPFLTRFALIHDSLESKPRDTSLFRSSLCGQSLAGAAYVPQRTQFEVDTTKGQLFHS